MLLFYSFKGIAFKGCAGADYAAAQTQFAVIQDSGLTWPISVHMRLDFLSVDPLTLKVAQGLYLA